MEKKGKLKNEKEVRIVLSCPFLFNSFRLFSFFNVFSFLPLSSFCSFLSFPSFSFNLFYYLFFLFSYLFPSFSFFPSSLCSCPFISFPLLSAFFPDTRK